MTLLDNRFGRFTVLARLGTFMTMGTLATSSLAAAPIPTGWPPAEARVVDRLVAVVNKEPVTLYELQRAAAPQVAKILRETKDAKERDDALRKTIDESLDQLVDDILVYDQAKKMDLTIQVERVDEHIKKIREANGWTEDELAEELKKLGFASLADYRRHTEREMLKSQVIGIKVASRVKIDEGDVETEYKRQLGQSGGIVERRSAHILIRLAEGASERDDAAARQKLVDIKKEIASGAITFGDAARKYSQDGTRNAGGDLGWYVRGDYDPSFEVASFATPKGEVSEPFRTPFGWHLVTTIDEREKKVTAAEDAETVKRQIRFQMREKQLERLYKQWVRGLRSDAFVELKDLGLDT